MPPGTRQLLTAWTAALLTVACSDNGSTGDDFWNQDGGDLDTDSGDPPDGGDWPNVYLDMLVESEWNPGLAGGSRAGAGNGLIGEDLVPTMNDRALGPPVGTGSMATSSDCTALGVGGSAAWRFDDDYYIHDGPGVDFVTFENSFAWGGAVDGLCCELAHVHVSEDLSTWYYNTEEQYDINPNPDENNDDYAYFGVEGLHGNNPTWANHTEEMQAQEIVDGEWVDIPDVFVSPDFAPDDPYLGGNAFDLADFRSLDDDSPWPADGRMKYVRIVDDPEILDGQDYAKAWCLGAQMHAAMGINVAPDE